jgi:hypothetical protein
MATISYLGVSDERFFEPFRGSAQDNLVAFELQLPRCAVVDCYVGKYRRVLEAKFSVSVKSAYQALTTYFASPSFG